MRILRNVCESHTSASRNTPPHLPASQRVAILIDFICFQTALAPRNATRVFPRSGQETNAVPAGCPHPEQHNRQLRIPAACDDDGNSSDSGTIVIASPPTAAAPSSSWPFAKRRRRRSEHSAADTQIDIGTPLRCAAFGQ